VYPDSAPVNWRDILDDLHIPWIESPLHDRDVDANGELKKAHWHVTVMFEGNKSFEQIKEITDKLNTAIPQKCHSMKGSVRYMTHMDNPEKYQYDKADIIGHGGADVAELLKPTSSSRYQLIREMMDYVRKENVYEFEDLVNQAMDDRFDDWFPLLCDNSAFIMEKYINSRRNRRNDAEQKE
jgi:hypothetical protein